MIFNEKNENPSSGKLDPSHVAMISPEASFNPPLLPNWQKSCRIEAGGQESGGGESI